MATGPSTSTAPYLVTLEPNVTITSLLTAGDALPGSTTGVFGGIPDGIGLLDNGDGTLTLITNHEFNNAAGTVRDHGSIGAYVETIILDKTTLEVISGDDAIKTLYLWDDVNDTYVTGTTAFSRFCSGDLAEVTAYYDAVSGLGTTARIYLTGEESGVEGRATATIVTGDETGNGYELPFLGNLAYENLTANPLAQVKTIVAATDDGQNGQVYIYVGDKQATGTEIDKAGLTNGQLYGIKVAGFANEINDTAVSGTFTLELITDAANKTGAQIDAESEAADVTSFLRPEDSAWDPENPNTLYFTTTNSFTGNSRLYKVTFTDITDPTLGGTVEAVLDGSEGQHMFDNLTVANGKVILQEDPGNQSYLAQVYEYDIASDTLNAIVSFDPAQFTPGEAGFITQDEESSGVIDVTSILGDEDTRAYLLDAQVHKTTGDPLTVEPAQILLLTIDTPTDGGAGDDAVNGDASDNKLLGKGGADVVKGGSGNDRLNGGNGDDSINGGAGDDRIDGGRGNDELLGGSGADVFKFGNYRSGDDVILDFNALEDELVFGTGNEVVAEAHGDFNTDGTADTLLTLGKGGTVLLLGVADYDDGSIIIT